MLLRKELCQQHVALTKCTALAISNSVGQKKDRAVHLDFLQDTVLHRLMTSLVPPPAKEPKEKKVKEDFAAILNYIQTRREKSLI